MAAGLLDRQFSSATPDRAWTGDITYIQIDQGRLYMAVILDIFNREVIGWSIKPRMTADIVIDALVVA